jgi:hypothetical protein
MRAQMRMPVRKWLKQVPVWVLRCINACVIIQALRVFGNLEISDADGIEISVHFTGPWDIAFSVFCVAYLILWPSRSSIMDGESESEDHLLGRSVS